MDPYELFGTPPGDLVMSSTPTKPTKKRAIIKRPPKQGKGSAKKKQKKKNLWDKCLATNPELAQFVQDFNQSLEEATCKPLDLETK